MSRRVYIHQAPGLHGRHKALVIGACALAVVLTVAVQAQLTFSQRAIAQAREEFSTLGEGMQTGMQELAPEQATIDEVKAAVVETQQSFAREIEIQKTLDAAAAAAAAKLESVDVEATVPQDQTQVQTTTP